MNIETLKKLGLIDIRLTQTILEMVERSTIKPEGVVDDVVVSVDSWEYHAYSFVLHPKLQLGGTPIDFGKTMADYSRCIH